MKIRQEADEDILRKFDLEREFGPSIGMLRIDRWKRAERFGKNPPRNVLETLKKDTASQQSHLK